MNRKKKEQFYKELSIALNKTDLKEVENIYRSFAKFIVDKVKNEEKIQCPDFGSFILSSIKARIAIVPATKEKKYVGSSLFIKFKPDYKVKRFLNDQ